MASNSPSNSVRALEVRMPSHLFQLSLSLTFICALYNFFLPARPAEPQHVMLLEAVGAVGVTSSHLDQMSHIAIPAKPQHVTPLEAA
jgi:hypothetical protein